jgi:hypothetical protein
VVTRNPSLCACENDEKSRAFVESRAKQIKRVISRPHWLNDVLCCYSPWLPVQETETRSLHPCLYSPSLRRADSPIQRLKDPDECNGGRAGFFLPRCRPLLLSRAQANLNTVPRRSQTLCNVRLPQTSLMQLAHSLRLSLCQSRRPTALAVKQALPLVTPILLVRQPLDRCVAILLHCSCLCNVTSLQSSHGVVRCSPFHLRRDSSLRPLHALYHNTIN